MLNNLADKLPDACAAKYGITPAELTALGNFRLWFNWLLDALAYGKGGATGHLTPPPAFALPAQPSVGGVTITPVADGFGLVGSLVARIKGHTAYTLAAARQSRCARLLSVKTRSPSTVGVEPGPPS